MGERGQGRWRLWAVCVLLASGAAAAAAAAAGLEPRPRPRERYGLYRELRAAGAAAGAVSGRRAAGGQALSLQRAGAPTVVALLDRYWATQCSGAWLARRWVLTAGHCAVPDIAYVRYNTLQPNKRDGAIATVVYVYRHPGFSVVQKETEGAVQEVLQLQHDVGLLGTGEDMWLLHTPGVAPLEAMLRRAEETAEVTALGFGSGDRLYAARLRLVECRQGPRCEHCLCAVGAGAGAGREAAAATVCEGDSGGPVLAWPGPVQVAIASLGPLQCPAAAAAVPGSVPGPARAVLTATLPYAAILNATMARAGRAIAARERADPRSAGAAPPALTHSAPHTLVVAAIIWRRCYIE